MNIKVFLLSILIFIIPYNLISENTANLFIMICGMLFILFQEIKQKSFSISYPLITKNLNKYYYIMLLFLVILGFLSFFTTKASDIFGSIHGLTIYINGIIFYKIFFNFDEEDKQKFYKYSVTILLVLSIFFIFYQGLILKMRVDGTIGYANTYSLLLLVGLYFNTLSKKSSFSNFTDNLLMFAILYTGSRNSFFYLILFIIFKFVKEFKSSKDCSIFFSFITSIICFATLQSGGIIMFIFIPPVLYISHTLTKNLRYFNKSVKSALLITFIAIGLVIFMIGKEILKDSLFLRLTTLSVHVGVLQERLVYFEDSSKNILSTIFGNGINSFSYKQYIDQSAFYDVRFIHNSVLQIAYDIGLLAAIVFIIILILGISIILRSHNKNAKYFLVLYITIFMHSLLDFDFSFASIFILFSACVAFVNTKQIDQKIVKFNNKAFNISCNILNILYVITFIFISLSGTYILSNDIMVFIGNTFYSHKSYNNALFLYKLSDKLEFKANPYICISIAQLYNQKGTNFEDLNNSIIFLKRAEKLNSYDPIITGNMAFTYDKLGKLSKANNYYLKFLKKERFYYKSYSLYYTFLQKHYSKNNPYYKNGKVMMKKTYIEAKKDLNKRAIYMKTQLPNNFSKLYIN